MKKKKQETHYYKVLYEIGEFTPEEAKETGKGATDAFIFISLIYPKDGSFSMDFFARDGRTSKPLDDLELFKVWWMLAKRLANSQTLDKLRKTMAQATYTSIWDVFKGTTKRQKKFYSKNNLRNN